MLKNASLYRTHNGHLVRYELREIFGLLVDNFDYGTNGKISTLEYFSEQKTWSNNQMNIYSNHRNKILELKNAQNDILNLEKCYKKYDCVFDVQKYVNTEKLDLFAVLNIIKIKFDYFLKNIYYWCKFTPLNMNDDGADKLDIQYSNILINQIIRKYKNSKSK